MIGPVVAEVVLGAKPGSGRSQEILALFPFPHQQAVGHRSEWDLLVVARVASG